MGAKVIGLSLDAKSEVDLFVAANVADRCESVFADLNDVQKWNRKIIDFEPEIVFHLAAQSLVIEGYRSPVSTFETNFMGTVRLLEFLRFVPTVKSVVIVTTDKVYRDVNHRVPFTEQDHLGGHDPYSGSKAACEIAVATYRKSFFEGRGVSISTARAGNVIGGGDWASSRLIPDAIRAWSRHLPLILRNPMSTRPWQHVLEPLAGYLVLAEKTYEDYSLSQSFNFGPLLKNNYSVQSVIEMAAKHFGESKIQIEESENQLHESDWLNLASDLALEKLNYSARLEIEDTVAWTIEWYKKSLSGAPAEALCINQIKDYISHPQETK
jgi:CDP-glucose 4,6-dehydratase